MTHFTPLAFHNDRLLPLSDVHIELHDAGFVWGATVTDLCRTVHHQLYRWEDHFARFRRSCRATRIFPPLSEEEITRYAHELVEHNVQNLSAQQDLILVMVATPGPIGHYLGTTSTEAQPTFIMHTFPLPCTRYRHLFEQGAHLVIPPIHHIPQTSIDPRIKQRSRLHWWLAEQEAKRIDPQASALLLDESGCITETAAANVLLVRDDIVMSPREGCILDGVSLQVVRELCAQLGIRWQERDLSPYDCTNADEAMLTSTPYCLAGVSRINDMPLPWPGPITQRLLHAWSEEIGLDVRAQILFTTGHA